MLNISFRCVIIETIKLRDEGRSDAWGDPLNEPTSEIGTLHPLRNTGEPSPCVSAETYPCCKRLLKLYLASFDGQKGEES